MENKLIPMIIPTIVKDYVRMKQDPKRLFSFLPVSEIIFIGSRDLCELIKKDSESFPEYKINALNEEELVPRQPVFDFLLSRVKEENPDIIERIRPGWYYQQFLKMAFYKICETEFYMSWDMDTIPLRQLKLFDPEDRPYFDQKREFNPGYFEAIKNLFGYEKSSKGSFVAEHMVFSKAYMEEMIREIEVSALKGDKFYEKIISAVDIRYAALGFSEFETYGTFVVNRHPDAYNFREFNSLRRGSWFLESSELTEEDMIWLSSDFHAITFEGSSPIPEMNALFRNPKYRSSMSAGTFYRTILESGYFGEYADGRIDAGDWYAPV